MIRNLVLIALIALAGTNGAAVAQDHLGVFFDSQGISTNFYTSTPNEEVTAYLIILDASVQTGVEYFWGTVEWSGGVSWWGATSNCNISWTPPPTMFAYCSPVLPWSSVMVVATYTFVVDTPTTPVDIFISIGEGEEPNYTPFGNDIGDTIQLYATSGSYDLPVATINQEPPVNVEVSSWGQFKVNFR